MKNLQRSTSSETLTPDQQAALEKYVAFLRDAMARTGGAHFKIAEMSVTPKHVTGLVFLQIRVDDLGQ